MDPQSSNDQAYIQQTPQPPLPPIENSNTNFWKYIGIGMSIVSFCIAIGAVGYIYSMNKNSNSEKNLTACTMEAKLCPDGSSVGRSGPKCEFAPCPTPTPTPNPTENWKTYTNTKYGFSVKYPPTFVLEDKSIQFPPLSIFIKDPSKNESYEGGSTINPYIVISSINTNNTLSDYISDPNNNLIFIKNETISGNSFFIAQEKFGAGTIYNRYFIKQGNSTIEIDNTNNYFNETQFNQILSTFKFTN